MACNLGEASNPHLVFNTAFYSIRLHFSFVEIPRMGILIKYLIPHAFLSGIAQWTLKSHVSTYLAVSCVDPALQVSNVI